MADYNLSIVGLVSPTQPGYIQAYRPTLAVKNTGTKPLTVAGNFSVYQRQAPGSLLFQTGFAPATVAAGATVQLLGATYWTPATATTYTISAHVTTNRPGLFRDFGPLALVISPDEPPEPPIVSAHATQHEYDGVDELNVTGLKGELDDPQSPKDHAARHEQGGTDEMSVTGLHGLLADAQPTAAHGNEKHTSLFVDATTLGDAIDDHNDSNTAHTDATNLEKTANKGAASGYAPLGTDSKVPALNIGGTPISQGLFLRSDSTWAQPPVVEHSVSHEAGGDDQISLNGLSGRCADPQTDAQAATSLLAVNTAGQVTLVDFTGPTYPDGTVFPIMIELACQNGQPAPKMLILRVMAGVNTQDLETISQSVFSLPGLLGAQAGRIILSGRIVKLITYARAALVAIDDLTTPNGPARTTIPTTTYKYIEDATRLRVTCEIESAGATIKAYTWAASIFAVPPNQ